MSAARPTRRRTANGKKRRLRTKAPAEPRSPPEPELETISSIEHRIQRERTIGERLAGLAVRAAGSMPFVVAHVLWFGAWSIVNLGLLPGVAPFDPFPFPFLTLVVSLEAIFLALLVLIAQNRISKEADQRALLDLQINLLAERESTKTLDILQRISGHLGLDDPARDEEANQLAAPTDVNELAEALPTKDS
jgi:uncharacterized membrane protein